MFAANGDDGDIPLLWAGLPTSPWLCSLVVGGSPDPPTRATEGLTNPANSVRPSVGAVGRSGDRPTTGSHDEATAARTPQPQDFFIASE